MHEMGLVFARVAASFGAANFRGEVLRGGVEPADEHGMVRDGGGVARQRGEDGLRDILRVVRVASDLPQRRRVDKAKVALHQCGKRRFGMAGGKLPHQRHVIAHHHLYMAAERGTGQSF